METYLVISKTLGELKFKTITMGDFINISSYIEKDLTDRDFVVKFISNQLIESKYTFSDFSKLADDELIDIINNYKKQEFEKDDDSFFDFDITDSNRYFLNIRNSFRKQIDKFKLTIPKFLDMSNFENNKFSRMFSNSSLFPSWVKNIIKPNSFTIAGKGEKKNNAFKPFADILLKKSSDQFTRLTPVGSVNKHIDDFIRDTEETEGNEYEDNHNNQQCSLCGQILKYSSISYSLIKENSPLYYFCSYDHLKKWRDDNQAINTTGYELTEYWKCKAYQKCQSIGNLRKMCEKSEIIKTSPDHHILVNFCNPAEAGLILSTYQINQTLIDFDNKIHKTFKDFNEGSNKQFKITRNMTYLVIGLTVINIAIAILTYFNKTPTDQLSELKNIKSEISNQNSNNLIYHRELVNISSTLSNINKNILKINAPSVAPKK